MVMKKVKKFATLLRHSAYRNGLRHGVAAAIEHEAFLKVQRIGTLLDAGANKGQFALATRVNHPSAKIIAFEPLGGPSAQFEALFRTDKNVRLVRAALGAENGDAQIHISRRNDSSSLLPIGKLQPQVFPGTEE